MPYEIWELTQEQKDKVLSLYESTKLADMVPLVFPDAPAEGRSIEGRSIQAFLAKENIKAPTKLVEDPTELTTDQKMAVERLTSRCKTTLELAQAVYNDKELKFKSKRYKLVLDYKNLVYPEGAKVDEEPVDSLQYVPPATIQTLIPVVNRWVTAGKANQKTYSWGSLKASQERCLDKLMGYVRSFSFIYTASQYERQVDRDLFVSQFVRWTHDKPDLTAIEVDQMVLACAERVNIAQIDRDIQRIGKIQDEIIAGNEVDENGKVRKLGMTDVELINAVRTKHESAKKRLSELMRDLEQVRSKRLDSQRDRYGSVVDILDTFMKDEETRNRVFLDEGVAEKEEDKAEVERLSGVDELMALISGQSKEEGAA